MAKKTGLGDVFGGLFDDGLYGSDESAELMKLKITDVEPNKEQPRKDFDEAALNELADSIREHGIIQPLTVRPYADGYQIVSGERRWRAAKIAGLKEVPVRIMDLTDEQTAQIALIENLQREDLNPIEEALGYQQLIEKYSMTQEEVAKQVGKARSSITNAIRLLTLPDDLRELVRKGELSFGHSKVLIGVQGEERQRELAEKVIRDGISVRALEKLAKQPSGRAAKKKPAKDKFLVEAEISLMNYVGKPVRIDKTKGKYTLSFDCKSEDELKELIALISNK